MPETYRGHPDARPDAPGRSAVLLVNLGTPDAPDARSVRRYLAEFLSDPRVVEYPRWLWYPILHGAILPLRSPRSAHLYRKVWTEAGSPLLLHSQALAQRLDAALGTEVEVALAMRYGNPSVASVLRRLDADGGLRRLLVLPLYPQYSATTTASAFDAVFAELRAWRWLPELRLVADYHADDAWLDALADSVQAHWDSHGRGERLLFSFHGVPLRYVRAGDPYFGQCLDSARAVAARLGLPRDAWETSFQSRVGREEWLRPYTEERVRRLAAEGVRRIDVVCPGFAVDCLETLEEIAQQNAGFFRAAGGETLSYVPCLNAGDAHVAALAALSRRHGAGWPGFDPALAAGDQPALRSPRRDAFGRA